MFSASSSGDDEGDVLFSTSVDEKGFLFHIVDGVDDSGEPGREKSFGGVLGEEGEFLLNFEVGIDEAKSVSDCFDFESADLSVEGGELSVDVGDADFVEVDECDFCDTGAGKCFGGPRADASDSDDGEVSGADTVEGFLPVEAGNSGEAVEVVLW